MPKSDQGATRDRYQVIPRSLIFLVKNEKVLMLKGAPNKRLWANQFNGIGGHIERGETVLAGARRELQEETGMVLEGLTLCGTVMVDASDEIGILIFIFKGEVGDEVELRDSGEGMLTWIEQEKIADQPLVEDLPVLIPRIIAHRQQDKPFFARSFYDECEKLVVLFED